MNKIIILVVTLLFWGCSGPNTVVSKDTIIKHDLVNIQELDPTLMVELKYSTTDNFMKMDVYGNLETCYMRKVPAQMLVKAHEILKTEHPELRLLIYDALRPRSIQWTLWNTLSDVPEKERTNFVADPRTVLSVIVICSDPVLLIVSSTLTSCPCTPVPPPALRIDIT